MDIPNKSPLKEAFHKVKEDISKFKQDLDSLKNLKEELNSLRNTQDQFKIEIINVCDILKELTHNLNKFEKIDKSIETLSQKIEDLHKEKIINLPLPLIYSSPYPIQIPLYIDTTDHHINSTDTQQNPLIDQKNITLNDPISQDIDISIGNRGVPTDRQTDQQTDQQTHFNEKNTNSTNPPNTFDSVSYMLENLDSMKKEIRLKFKRLTDQEMLVFSTVYSLDLQKGHTDYKELSDKLKLTESSIRDYIGRLISKGIPLDKTKINNKTIHISISPSLKKIASMETIMKLREI